MTTQVPDQVIYNNCEYIMAGLKGEGLLTPKDIGIKPVTMSTACYRGYYCDYMFIDDEMYLVEMRVRTEDNRYPPIDGISAKIVLDVIGHYEGLQIPCPLSGGLVVVREPMASRIQAVVLTPASYSIILELILKNGKILKVIDHSDKMHDIRQEMDQIPDSSDKWNTIDNIEWSFAPEYKQQPSF